MASETPDLQLTLHS